MLALLVDRPSGGARQLCPGISDVDFLCNLNGVVNLDAKVAHRALDLRVAEQRLNSAQIPSPPVDQRRLGPSQGVRSELQRVKTNAGDPLANQARILPGRQTAIGPPPASEQELSRSSASDPQMLVDGMPGLFGQLEPNRTTGLFLTNGSPVEGVTIGCNIVNADCYHVTAAQLTVDRKIEEGQIAGSPLQLEPRPD